MLNKIINIAIEAGYIIMKYYGQKIDVTYKEGDSPLTKADLEANKYITSSLKKLDPTIPIISEEATLPDYEERQSWSMFWLVDPLDGTKEFIQQNGEFTVNIALIKNGMSTLGVIYIPAKQCLYYAQNGVGSFKKVLEKPAHRIFSQNADRTNPLVVIESRSHKNGGLDGFLNTYSIQIKRKVSAGSSLKFCYVAEGLADVYPRLGPTMEWDVAAGDCIYRNSAKQGLHKSPFTYNKHNLRNESFIIGI